MRWPGPDVGSVAFPASDARSVSFPGADREIVAFPPAPMLVIPIDAAVSGIGTVAATLVTTPVYPMDVNGIGTASAAVTATSVISAGVTGEGEALAVFAQLIEAPVSGVGTASVGVKPSITLAAGVSGSGTASVTVTPVATIVAAASCEGIPGVDAWPAALVTIAASGSGTASAALTARTPINASASGEGTPTAAVAAVTFKPSGMVKSADSNITATAATLVTGMAANANLPGSTVTSDALVSAFAGPVRVGFSIQLSSSGGTTGNAAVFKNGVQVGDAFTMTVPYNGASLITGSTVFTVAVGDAITLRYWSASASYPVSVKATTTRLNMSAGDSIALGGAVSANYTPGDGWTDMPIVADSGTTLDGNAIVVPKAHPNAILTAAANISSGSPMALRFLVNGTVVHTGPTAPAYDVRMIAATGIALAAGDLVKCQVQRISTFATTISSGASFKIV